MTTQCTAIVLVPLECGDPVRAPARVQAALERWKQTLRHRASEVPGVVVGAPVASVLEMSTGDLLATLRALVGMDP